MPELRPLRLVEMQLTAKTVRTDPWNKDEVKAREGQSETMREHEARRCHVCRCTYPSFGFGPPLTPRGVVLWACGTHRAEVDRSLTGTAAKPDGKPQCSLF